MTDMSTWSREEKLEYIPICSDILVDILPTEEAILQMSPVVRSAVLGIMYPNRTLPILSSTNSRVPEKKNYIIVLEGTKTPADLPGGNKFDSFRWANAVLCYFRDSPAWDRSIELMEVP